MNAAEAVEKTVADLECRREPYVMVRVVWVRAPSSGKPGCHALVKEDGGLVGWIGGACSRGAVVEHSQAALVERRPRILCVGKEAEFAAPDEGRFLVASSCSSKGSLELFLEPRFPRPQLVVFGDQPVSVALGTMARAVGFEVVAVVREVQERPEAHRMLDHLDLTKAFVGEDSFLVVATMGLYDKDALRAALGTEAPYIALVASRRRAAMVLDGLRKEGYSETQLSRIRAPAGLDLGSIEHEEIAVSVLAEVIKTKASLRARIQEEPSSQTSMTGAA